MPLYGNDLAQAWHNGYQEALKKVREEVEKKRMNISDKIETPDNFRYALNEIKKHELGFNQAIDEVLSVLNTLNLNQENMTNEKPVTFIHSTWLRKIPPWLN